MASPAQSTWMNAAIAIHTTNSSTTTAKSSWRSLNTRTGMLSNTLPLVHWFIHSFIPIPTSLTDLLISIYSTFIVSILSDFKKQGFRSVVFADGSSIPMSHVLRMKSDLLEKTRSVIWSVLAILIAISLWLRFVLFQYHEIRIVKASRYCYLVDLDWILFVLLSLFLTHLSGCLFVFFFPVFLLVLWTVCSLWWWSCSVRWSDTPVLLCCRITRLRLGIVFSCRFCCLWLLIWCLGRCSPRLVGFVYLFSLLFVLISFLIWSWLCACDGMRRGRSKQRG